MNNDQKMPQDTSSNGIKVSNAVKEKNVKVKQLANKPINSNEKVEKHQSDWSQLIENVITEAKEFHSSEDQLNGFISVLLNESGIKCEKKISMNKHKSSLCEITSYELRCEKGTKEFSIIIYDSENHYHKYLTVTDNNDKIEIVHDIFHFVALVGRFK